MMMSCTRYIGCPFVCHADDACHERSVVVRRDSLVVVARWEASERPLPCFGSRPAIRTRHMPCLQQPTYDTTHQELPATRAASWYTSTMGNAGTCCTLYLVEASSCEFMSFSPRSRTFVAWQTSLLAFIGRHGVRSSTTTHPTPHSPHPPPSGLVSAAALDVRHASR